MLKMNGVIEGAVRRIEAEEEQCAVKRIKVEKASGPSRVIISVSNL